MPRFLFMETTWKRASIFTVSISPGIRWLDGIKLDYFVNSATEEGDDDGYHILWTMIA